MSDSSTTPQSLSEALLQLALQYPDNTTPRRTLLSAAARPWDSGTPAGLDEGPALALRERLIANLDRAPNHADAIGALTQVISDIRAANATAEGQPAQVAAG